MEPGWREELRRISSLEGYRGGLSARQAERIYGVKLRRALNLQSNENLFIPRAYSSRILRRAAEMADPRLYPKDVLDDLKGEIARYLGVKPEMVLLGQGADELIGLLAALFGKGGVGHFVPTYSYYGVMASAYGHRVVGGETADEILSGRPSIVFVCTPNNPTGELIPEEEVMKVVEAGPLTVIDEIYAEISGTSHVRLAIERDNVVVLRSFSKAFGLAGLRVGYAVGPEGLISALSKVQHPFPITTVSALAAIEALRHRGYFEGRWREARETMAWFRGRLADWVRSSNSAAYFLTVSTRLGSEELFVELLRHGYITRIVEPFRGFPNPLRINLAPRKLIEDLPDLINAAARASI